MDSIGSYLPGNKAHPQDASYNQAYLPGNTILPQEDCYHVALPSFHKQKKTIVLASNEINDESLFINGLTQNIIILYDLFEAMGYQCKLLQTNISTNKKVFLNRYTYVKTSELISSNHPVHIFIEIGMSIDEQTRKHLRSKGTRITKLYLGNILNIDIETIQHYSSMFFNHHIVGEIDEIWTSPHYKQHVDYAAVINRTSIKSSRVVPYVWDPCFIEQYALKSTSVWQPPVKWETQDIVITDPSISFQKCSFYSVLLVEAFAKAHPEWKGKLHVVNGDRLKISANAFNKVIQHLQIYQTNRLLLYPRKKITQIMEDHRSACFITHQWNNDYNYMTLELIHYHFPILHNSDGWADYGYYYSINKWEKAIELLYNVLTTHKDQLSTYQTHAYNLIWKHSIHNPAIQQRWEAILE
jgi:hypothetical protein